MGSLRVLCSLCIYTIVLQINRGNCEPKPQWGVPAAADAANGIDMQRYQAQAMYQAYHQQQSPQQFPVQQHPVHQFPPRNTAPSQLAVAQPKSVPPVLAEAVAPVNESAVRGSGPSLTGPISQTAPKSPPPKGMRRPKRRKILKKRKKARKIGQPSQQPGLPLPPLNGPSIQQGPPMLPPNVAAFPQGSPIPPPHMAGLQGGPIMRQDSYPNYYYPGQVAPRKPEWGFWKWGRDNLSGLFG